ncbi:hypothetical protein PORY_002696 [Pneumocystis oryctolagi]|uniref:Uncharacterized protein n=1 Tax=Pneumocystis oryctolagi TaxID=42067 RepID=A0ACB7CA31_9ASCO|nr:hypothetical protein PORY_002696 [Pneumocystis oryctolagi]
MLLDRVKEIIQESKACRDDMRMRQQAFQESLKYLGSLKEEAHWFCAQEPLNALVQESLQLFGFSGSDALSWLKGRMKRQLSACYLCVRGYQMLKREAAKAYEGNEEFMRGLREFDYERLSEAISEAILGVEGEGGVIKMWMRMMVYECLWETGLLLETDLFEKFKWFFLRIQRDGKFLRIDDEVVPGMIVFLFEEKCQELSVWAEKSLEKLSRKLTLSEFAWVAKMPFTVAMDRYLKSTGGHTPWLSAVPVSTFWKGSSVLFRYIEKESIIIELSSQGWDIVGLTCSRLSSENTPVVLDVLNTFSELLNVLGSTFWEQAMYCSPFNAIDAIFQNDYIRKMIKTFSEINEPSSVLFTQPFTWIKPFISSLQNSNKHHLCSKFLFYLLEYFQNDEYPKESKDYCKIAAYQALSFAFEGLLESDSLDFGTYLILLEENRKVFENYLKIIVEESLFSTQTNDCVKKQACLLVGLVLNMDCRILQQEFCNIKKNQEPDNSIITIKNYGCGKIWDILIQNTQKCDLNLISQIFQSFSLLSYIEIIHTEFERSIHFNKIAMDMILKMTRLLSVIDEVNYNIFKIMLQVPEINYSVILLIFSPVLEISQLSFNIVKHAYNCIDYYEAFRFSLSHNFVSTLIGLINVIDNFIDIQSFTIASQLIKISVIVLDVLCSSENGLLLLDEYKSDENQSVLILLWSRFWILLNMLFSGKIDEILGPMNQVYFTVKPQEGIIASSFHTGDKVYIGNDKLLPLERFLSQPKSSIPKKTQVSSRGGYQNRSRGLYRGLGFCGIMSVFSSMKYCLGDPLDTTWLWKSITLMPLGLCFDFLDGKIARWRKKSSLMGKELDSLADLVSFGVAPSAFAFALGIRTLIDTIILSFFVLCGISRLARFNISVDSLPKDKHGKLKYFEGTPIPTSLSIVAMMAWCVRSGWILENLPLGVIYKNSFFEFHPIVIIFALSGCAMCSKRLKIRKI